IRPHSRDRRKSQSSSFASSSVPRRWPTARASSRRTSPRRKGRCHEVRTIGVVGVPPRLPEGHGNMMHPATSPRSRTEVRVLVLDGEAGAMRLVSSNALASLFDAKDLLVVNDAATLPASLRARIEGGELLELRLLGALADRRWTVALLGSGDYRTPT